MSLLHRTRTVLFRSNDEFFQAVRDLAGRLDAEGHPDAAARLRNGLSCINGLTDGWAQFLQAIDDVEKSHGHVLQHNDCKVLAAIRDAAHAAVYRR